MPLTYVFLNEKSMAPRVIRCSNLQFVRQIKTKQRFLPPFVLLCFTGWMSSEL